MSSAVDFCQNYPICHLNKILNLNRRHCSKFLIQKIHEIAAQKRLSYKYLPIKIICRTNVLWSMQ